MMEATEYDLIKKMAKDISFLKSQISHIKITVGEIDADMHRQVDPDYLEKLKKIRKQKGVKFKGMEEFDKYFSA